MDSSRYVPRGWGLLLLGVAALSLLVAGVGQTQTSSLTGKPAAATKASGSGRVVLYTGIGTELTQYDLDVDAATLTKRGSVTVPGDVTEATFHPSRKYLYVVWGGLETASGKHGIRAFSIDPASGALLPHGQAPLPDGPGYTSFVTTDIPGTHVLASMTDPSSIIVYRIAPDGTVGPEVKPATPLDFGIHAHQVRVDPSNKTMILITLGVRPTATTPEDPGAVKMFSYKDGMLMNRFTITPIEGDDFEPRHLDFHRSGRWDFLTLERQNKLLVYERQRDGTLSSSRPLFIKNTLADPGNVRPGQILGTVHVHPKDDRFLYVANRDSRTVDFQGKRVWAGGENNIGVFEINQNTGEPTLIQTIDTRGFEPRTFSLDPSGKILIALNMRQILVRDGDGVHIVPASLAVYRVGGDGKLEFVSKYDVPAGGEDWVGITSLP